MKTENVFKILGEGGGICISRQKSGLGEKFIYNHTEFDPTDGLDIYKKDIYDNFEQPFLLINKTYSWYKLELEVVHEEYRNYIIERLLEKLNAESVSPDYLSHKLITLENSLEIKLNYRKNPLSNNLTWSCDKSNQTLRK